MARIYGVPKQSGGGVVANVKVVGIPQLLAKLKLVGNVARLELGLMNAGAAQMMYRLATAYVPVRTGNLKSGIEVTKLGPFNWQVAASSLAGNVAEKNGKEYAGFVENGTSNMSGRFFMRRAWTETSAVARSDLQIIARKIQSL